MRAVPEPAAAGALRKRVNGMKKARPWETKNAVSGSCGRTGFTLVEVVVASALMMIMFVAVLESFSFARRSASLSGSRLANLHTARQALETLRAESYSSPFLNAGNRKRPIPGLPSAAGYYDVAVNNTTKVKDITVVIEWVDPTGMEQSLSLMTSLSETLHK